MNPLALQKAKSRLATARKALADLDGCADYDTFVGLWYTFLTAAKGIYTVLEQGSKTSPQSMQWFGGRAKERRTDPLLQYLYQARDDDEHGLSQVTKLAPGALAIGVNKPGYSTNITVSGKIGRGLEGLTVTSGDGKPVLIEETFPHAELVAVHGRGHQTYDPPREHLGVPIEKNLPLQVARLAVDYFEALVSAAEKLS